MIDTTLETQETRGYKPAQEIIGDIVLKSVKVAIEHERPVLSEIYEQDALTGDEYSEIGQYIYRQGKDLGYRQLPTKLSKTLESFKLCAFSSEAYLMLKDSYIPTERSTGHTTNTQRPLYVIKLLVTLDSSEQYISPLTDDSMEYGNDPLFKALTVLGLPVNKECLVIESLYTHIKELIVLSQLSVELETLHTVSLKHKRTIATDLLEHPLEVLSTDKQKEIAVVLNRHFPILHYPVDQAAAQSQSDDGNLKLSSLQAYCLYQELSCGLSEHLYSLGLYAHTAFFVELDSSYNQLKETGSFNLKFSVDESKLLLSEVFWGVLNKGLIFDIPSFKSNVSLKVSENIKNDQETLVYTESKNDNIHFNSTYYELLLRLMVDEGTWFNRFEIDDGVKAKDWNKVTSALAGLELFK